jgi:hypothetical protein
MLRMVPGEDGRRRQIRDRFEEALAVPERNAELLEIGFGELRQDFGVDRVLAEKGEVLAKPEAPQPVAHIHRLSPEGGAMIL